MSFRAYDVLEIVKDNGLALVLRKQSTAGTYDPATGTVVGSGTTDYNFIGYFYDITDGQKQELRRGTRRCVIPALGFPVVPDDEDIIIGPTGSFGIEKVLTIFNTGSAVCYLCDVRD
jgi:hypothetical protein